MDDVIARLGEPHDWAFPEECGASGGPEQAVYYRLGNGIVPREHRDWGHSTTFELIFDADRHLIEASADCHFVERAIEHPLSTKDDVEQWCREHQLAWERRDDIGYRDVRVPEAHLFFRCRIREKRDGGKVHWSTISVGASSRADWTYRRILGNDPSPWEPGS